jgi:hypothetical protein
MVFTTGWRSRARIVLLMQQSIFSRTASMHTWLLELEPANVKYGGCPVGNRKLSGYFRLPLRAISVYPLRKQIVTVAEAAYKALLWVAQARK